MTNIRFWIGGAALALLVLLATACDCDDPTDPSCSNYCQDETDPLCPNYDPCLGIEPIEADIVIEQGLDWGHSSDMTDYAHLIETDTVVEGEVFFKVRNPSEKLTYTWCLEGDDRRWEGASFRLTFSANSAYLTPRVTLVAELKSEYYEAYNGCIPDSLWHDSTEKSFHVVTFRDVPMIGKWKGSIVNRNPDSVFILTIDNPPIGDLSQVGTYYFNTLSICHSEPCEVNPSYTDNQSVLITYRAMRFRLLTWSWADFYAPLGEIRVNESKDSIEIAYWVWLYDDPEFPDNNIFENTSMRRFRGVRIE